MRRNKPFPLGLISLLFVLATNHYPAYSEERTHLARAFLVTTSQSVNDTSIHIINTSSNSQTYTGNLYNQNGDRLGNEGVIINSMPTPTKARLIMSANDLEDIFSVPPWIGPAILEVKSSGTLDVMTKLASPSGLVSNTNCVRSEAVHNIEPFNSETLTYIRFINIGDQEIPEIRGTMHDSEGSIIGEENMRFLQKLKPKQAIWLSSTKIRAIVGGAWGSMASLTLTSPSPDLKLLNLNLVNGSTFFNFSCFENQEEGNVYLFTNSESNNFTEAHLINTSNAQTDFFGSLYNSDGLKLGESDTRLSNTPVPSKGRLIITAALLEKSFNTLPWVGPALLEISGAGQVELLTRLKSPSGLISNTNCVRKRFIHNIEGFNSNTLTYIRLINKSNTEIKNVVGTLYDKDGRVLGKRESLLREELRPKEQVWISNRQLERMFEVSWFDEASLEVTADEDANLRLLNLNFENNETFFNFSCFESSIDKTK